MTDGLAQWTLTEDEESRAARVAYNEKPKGRGFYAKQQSRRSSIDEAPEAAPPPDRTCLQLPTPAGTLLISSLALGEIAVAVPATSSSSKLLRQPTQLIEQGAQLARSAGHRASVAAGRVSTRVRGKRLSDPLAMLTQAVDGYKEAGPAAAPSPVASKLAAWLKVENQKKFRRIEDWYPVQPGEPKTSAEARDRATLRAKIVETRVRNEERVRQMWKRHCGIGAPGIEAEYAKLKAEEAAEHAMQSYKLDLIRLQELRMMDARSRLRVRRTPHAARASPSPPPTGRRPRPRPLWPSSATRRPASGSPPPPRSSPPPPPDAPSVTRSL